MRCVSAREDRGSGSSETSSLFLLYFGGLELTFLLGFLIRKMHLLHHFFLTQFWVENYDVFYSPEVNESKQGRPPRESEKGAVRCGRRAMRGHHSVCSSVYYSGKLCYFLDSSIWGLLLRQIMLLLDPSIWDLLLRQIMLLLDPSIWDLLLRQIMLLLDPSIRDLLLRQIMLLLDPSIWDLLLRQIMLLFGP